MTVIDTTTNHVIGDIAIGQAPQALVYVPNAVPAGATMGLQAGEGQPMGPATQRAGTVGLSPLGLAGQSAHLTLQAPGHADGDSAKPPTSVALFDQGLLQVLEASVTALEPGRPYALALSRRAGGGGDLEVLASFMTNAAGAAIVNAVGPIRQLVRDPAPAERRYLVVAPGLPGELGVPVQLTSAVE